MAEKVGDAFVEIGARLDKLEAGLKKGKSKVSGFAKFAKRAGAVIGTALAGRAIVRGIGSTIAAFNKQEAATAKLGAVLSATGYAAGFTAEQMQEHAAALQEVTTFGDEAINNTQAVLATFKNIKGDVFKDATESILDMAVVLDQDAKQGAIQLGKALNDPIKGVTALTRVGVSFTQAQKDQIEKLQKSNDIMGAQKVILDELKGEFGGAAKAATGTFGGQLKQLGNIFGDLKEGIGGALVELFNMGGGTEWLKGKLLSLTKRIKDLADAGVLIQWSETIRAVAKKIWIALKTPFVVLGTLIGAVFADAAAKIDAFATNIAKAFEGDFNFVRAESVDVSQAMADAFQAAADEISQIDKEMADNISKRQKDKFESDAKGMDGAIKNEKYLYEAKKKTLSIFSSFAEISKKAQEAASTGGGGGGAGAAVAGGGAAGGGGGGGGNLGGDSVVGLLKKIEANTAKMAVFA